MQRLSHIALVVSILGSAAAQEAEPKSPLPPQVGADLKHAPFAPQGGLLPEPSRAPAKSGHGGGIKPQAGWPQRTGTRGPFAGMDEVLFDQQSDGTVLAAGRDHKVSFAPDGTTTYVPFFGSDAPRSHPVRFRMDRVTIGGRAAALPAAVAPQRSGSVVSYRRGSLTERWYVRPDGAEQTFEFAALPAQRGELLLSIDVGTELAIERDGSGFRFRNELGAVTYSQAVAFDATGNRVTLVTEQVGGRTLQIRVPADVVAAAELPLTIDPIVGVNRVVHTASRQLHEPDIAYDAAADRYIVVFERVFSQTDSDVFAYETDADGVPIQGSMGFVDISTASWQQPGVANNALAGRNLVVAQVSQNSSSPFSIHGRVREAGSTTMGNAFVIADASLAGHFDGNKLAPDVGGDPSPSGPTYFTVVWQREVPATDHDIHMKQVTSDLNPSLRSAQPTLIDNAATWEGLPAISNSNGAPPSTIQRWGIVYQRNSNLGEIHAAFVTWDGQVTTRTIVHSGSSEIDGSPSVSTPTLTDPGGQRRCFVAWLRGYLTIGGDTHDVMGAVVDPTNGSRVAYANLTSLEPEENGFRHRSWNQVDPQVDCDGCRFAVAYVEDWRGLHQDWDVRVSTFQMRRGQIAVADSRAWIASRSTIEGHPAIASTKSTGGAGLRYGVAWDEMDSAGSYAIWLGRYDGMSPDGGVTRLPTACAGLGISHSGTPALGTTLRVQAGAGAMGLIYGLPFAQPLTVCPGLPCRLGVDGTVFPSLIDITPPCNGNIVGLTVAVQAYSLTGGTCLGGVRLSDTLAITVR